MRALETLLSEYHNKLHGGVCQEGGGLGKEAAAKIIKSKQQLDSINSLLNSHLPAGAIVPSKSELINELLNNHLNLSQMGVGNVAQLPTAAPAIAPLANTKTQRSTGAAVVAAAAAAAAASATAASAGANSSSIGVGGMGSGGAVGGHASRVANPSSAHAISTAAVSAVVGVGGSGGGSEASLDGGTGAAQALVEKELKENDLKDAQRSLALLEQKAERLFAAGDYEAALKSFTEITGAGGALLRWSDQNKFVALRARQAACSLSLAHSLVNSGHHLAAIKGYSDTLAMHTDCMPRSDIIDARLQRDSCLLLHVRQSTDAEDCVQVLRCVQRGVEVIRPSTIDSGLWSTWRKKDKNMLLLLLEARIEQLRDYKSGSPTYTVGKEKLEAVLRWYDDTHNPPACAAASATPAAATESDQQVAVQDAHEFASEIVLWLAAAQFALATSGTSDGNFAACHDALQVCVRVFVGGGGK